jgi:gluconolactonase
MSFVMKSWLSLFVLLISSLIISAQDTLNFSTIGEIKRLDPRIDKLIPNDAKVEVLSSGFIWSEGPAWDKRNEVLLFSDVHRNQIIRWKEGEGKSVFMQPSGYTGIASHPGGMGSNGLAFDAEGNLILCEHGDRRLAILTPGGGKRTLVDNYNGKRLNSPNDVCIATNGDMYFTDPPYGLPKQENDLSKELDYSGVYLRKKSGELILIVSNLQRPNGVCLSPDEKTLYLSNRNDDWTGYMAYPVNKDGTVGMGKRFYDVTEAAKTEKGGADGIRTDTGGNLWATGPGGVYVFSPEGDVLGIIHTGERIGNCTFGNDGSVLYITSDTYLCRVRTSVTGTGF